MSDPRPSAPSDGQPPAWLARALAAPVPADPAAIDRLMDAVRHSPAPMRWAPPPSRTRWRRGVLGPATGFLATAGCLAVLAIGQLTGVGRGGPAATATVLKDTVIARIAGLDTLGEDTLRIVRFALAAPSASRVALVATLADGRTQVADAARTGAARWVARAVVPRDVLHYAFLVDDTRRVPVSTRF